MSIPNLTRKQAERAGYKPITHPCLIHSAYEPEADAELELWHKIKANFYGCNVVQVDADMGPEIWRHRDELDIDPTTGTKRAKYVPGHPTTTN